MPSLAALDSWQGCQGLQRCLTKPGVGVQIQACPYYNVPPATLSLLSNYQAGIEQLPTQQTQVCLPSLHVALHHTPRASRVAPREPSCIGPAAPGAAWQDLEVLVPALNPGPLNLTHTWMQSGCTAAHVSPSCAPADWECPFVILHHPQLLGTTVRGPACSQASTLLCTSNKESWPAPRAPPHEQLQ